MSNTSKVPPTDKNTLLLLATRVCVCVCTDFCGCDMSEGVGLWRAIQQACVRATVSGALKRIHTHKQPMHMQVPGYPNTAFIVRVAENLRHKPKPKQHTPPNTNNDKKIGEWFDPFARENLEKDLFVAKLSETHSLILNKFNVVDNHLLLITNDFESQNDPVNTRDYEHIFRVFASFPKDVVPMAFYNHGPYSGKSQPHKHVQIVPMPIADILAKRPTTTASTGIKEEEVVMERVFPLHHLIWKTLEGKEVGQVCEVEGLSYMCYAMRVNKESFAENGECLHHSDVLQQAEGSYNLLLTPTWWMLVPRSKERYGPIGINAMGFAGTLLCRTKEEMELIIRTNPMDILNEVGQARPVTAPSAFQEKSATSR